MLACSKNNPAKLPNGNSTSKGSGNSDPGRRSYGNVRFSDMAACLVPDLLAIRIARVVETTCHFAPCKRTDRRLRKLSIKMEGVLPSHISHHSKDKQPTRSRAESQKHIIRFICREEVGPVRSVKVQRCETPRCLGFALDQDRTHRTSGFRAKFSGPRRRCPPNRRSAVGHLLSTCQWRPAHHDSLKKLGRQNITAIDVTAPVQGISHCEIVSSSRHHVVIGSESPSNRRHGDAGRRLSNCSSASSYQESHPFTVSLMSGFSHLGTL